MIHEHLRQDLAASLSECACRCLPLSKATSPHGLAAMSLNQMPDDILQEILYHVSPEDNLRCLQLLSRRFQGLASQSLLWRHHCCNSFKYWSPHHGFREKLRLAAPQVEWKHLFLVREQRNRWISELFEAILASSICRWKRMQQICRLGYDAKDFLLAQLQTYDSAPDVLARRYFSHTILGGIHRSIAVKEWYNLGLDRDSLDAQIANRRLERALSAFDMFVLYDQPGDMDDISQILDEMAAEFRANCQGFPEFTTRMKALALNRWLRDNGLTGMHDPERNFRNLRNCFIGQALLHEDHESTPLVSSAIFCCLASRLGVNAHCCTFPSHVYVIVLPQNGHTLDNVPFKDSGEPEPMYLDPYGADNEVPASSLRDLLARVGLYTSAHSFLAPVPPISMVLRNAKNIRASLSRIDALNTRPEPSQLLRGNCIMNVERACHSAAWSSMMMTPSNTVEWTGRLRDLVSVVVQKWPEDAWLIEEYIWPMRVVSATPGDNSIRHNPFERWQLILDQNDTEPLMSIRVETSGPNQPFPLKVGQVFRHNRYGWIGVIVSWHDLSFGQKYVVQYKGGPDKKAEALECARRRPDTGWPKEFYRCLKSVRAGTLSEEALIDINSMEIIHDSTCVSLDMFPTAGKYFKRFDPDTCTFVSNIKELYPYD